MRAAILGKKNSGAEDKGACPQKRGTTMGVHNGPPGPTAPPAQLTDVGRIRSRKKKRNTAPNREGHGKFQQTPL